MEIKAKLNKPYTEEQRIDFIVEQNHNKGYEIRETKIELQAWGYTEEEIAQQERQQLDNLVLTNQELRNAFKVANKELDIPNIYQYQDFKRSDSFICSLPYGERDLDYLFKYKSLPY